MHYRVRSVYTGCANDRLGGMGDVETAPNRSHVSNPCLFEAEVVCQDAFKPLITNNLGRKKQRRELRDPPPLRHRRFKLYLLLQPSPLRISPPFLAYHGCSFLYLGGFALHFKAGASSSRRLHGNSALFPILSLGMATWTHQRDKLTEYR